MMGDGQTDVAVRPDMPVATNEAHDRAEAEKCKTEANEFFGSKFGLLFFLWFLFYSLLNRQQWSPCRNLVLWI
jgi:hypothetical protein